MRQPAKGLTAGEENALGVYQRYIAAWGEPPSVRQFAAELGVHPNAAHYYITRLRDKGHLSARPVTLIRPTLTRKGKRTS